MTTLRPCPFCHSTDVSVETSFAVTRVECGRCGAMGPSFEQCRKHGPRGQAWASDAAARAWNGNAGEILVALEDCA